LLGKMLGTQGVAATSQKQMDANTAAQLLQQAIDFQQANKFDEALTIYQQLLAAHPNDYRVLSLVSSLHLHLKAYELCLSYVTKSISINPNQAEAHDIAGDAYTQLNRFEQAAASYEQSIALKPGIAAAHYHCANAYQLAKLDDQALVHYQHVIALKPDYAEAQHNLGVILWQKKRLNEALQCFNKAIELLPSYANAYMNCANVLADLNKHEFAVAHYNYAIELNPKHAITYNNRGVAHNKLKQYDLALEDYACAKALDSNYAAPYLNGGNTLRSLERHDEALASYNQAIELDSMNAQNYINRGNLYLDSNRFALAIADYDYASTLASDNATSLWNKALLKILLGEYEEGWHLYEYGFDAEGPPRGYRKPYTQPNLVGNDPKAAHVAKEALAGKRVMLHAEQGLGDAIQFARYAPMVAALGAKIILNVHKPLLGLMSTLSPDYEFVEKEQQDVQFDYHCSLMSLPFYFKTTVDSVPSPQPYLAVDQSKKAGLKLAEKKGLRVGLVWSGSLSHAKDYKRSIPLAQLAPLMQLPIEFHGLQKEIRPPDQATLDAGMPIQLHIAELNDFTDTAALIDEMDVVISVDTSVAHLAGAIGKPIWILLPLSPDYRWLLDRQDSPWYSTARLFRQTTLGDWDGVIAEVKSALQALKV